MQPCPSKPAATLQVMHMSLYPTLSSLQDVVALADSKIPITDKNELFTLLMTFQNTLLKTLHEQATFTH